MHILATMSAFSDEHSRFKICFHSDFRASKQTVDSVAELRSVRVNNHWACCNQAFEARERGIASELQVSKCLGEYGLVTCLYLRREVRRYCYMVNPKLDIRTSISRGKRKRKENKIPDTSEGRTIWNATFVFVHTYFVTCRQIWQPAVGCRLLPFWRNKQVYFFVLRALAWRESPKTTKIAWPEREWPKTNWTTKIEIDERFRSRVATKMRCA